ncbi:MAG: hypothetical protein PVI24_12905, partial [Myxococcales bacterium]
MKWLLRALVIAIAGCNAGHPVAKDEPGAGPENRGREDAGVPWQQNDARAWELGGPFYTSLSLEDFLDEIEDETWGDSDRAAAAVTLGERIGQDPREDLWEWTDCSRFYAKARLGGPNGDGQVVRTSSRSRYRVWSLNPLIVEVEIHGFVGEPANRFEFFDPRGVRFMPTDEADLQSLQVQGVETLHCDGRARRTHTGNWVEKAIPPARRVQRERGAGWVECRGLRIVTADGTSITARGDEPSSLRFVRDDAVEWVTGDGFEKRSGVAAQARGVRCEGQELPGMPRASDKEPRRDCAEPTYNPSSRNWKRLSPAKVAASSDHCVGYCFRAFVDSVTEEAPRVARVAIIEEDRTLGKATLRRGTRLEGSDRAIDEGRP